MSQQYPESQEEADFWNQPPAPQNDELPPEEDPEEEGR